MNGRKQVRRSGFTLIEVLLVAGILALLAAFAIPQLMNRGDKARVDITQAAVGRNGSIAGALDHYRMDIGSYPEDLTALYEAPSDVEDKWEGPYMKGTFDELKDPWGNPYEYKMPGDVNEGSYDLWSIGKDRQDDRGKEGSDDIKNWIDK